MTAQQEPQPDKIKDVNDAGRILGPEGAARLVRERLAEAEAGACRSVTLEALSAKVGTEYKPATIHGLLRIGETMTVIAPPKVGKSYLSYHIALSIVTGRPLLIDTWTCACGAVGILDNEQHEETISARLCKFIETKGLDDSVKRAIHIWPLRGQLKPLVPDAGGHNVAESDSFLLDILNSFKDKGVKLLVIDALYRFLPAGCSENDNATITRMFNRLDEIATALKCSIIAIHHTSKGIQSEKSVTDVGAGGGAQARAADTHLVLREHEEPMHYVLEARCKTFEQPKPITLKWEHPVWTPTDLDPTKLKSMQQLKKIPDSSVNDDLFVSCLTADWKDQGCMVSDLKKQGLTVIQARGLMGSVKGKYGLDDLQPDSLKKFNKMEVKKIRNSLKFRKANP